MQGYLEKKQLFVFEYQLNEWMSESMTHSKDVYDGKQKG